MDDVAGGGGNALPPLPTKEALVDAILGDLLERHGAFMLEAYEAGDAFAGLGIRRWSRPPRHAVCAAPRGARCTAPQSTLDHGAARAVERRLR